MTAQHGFWATNAAGGQRLAVILIVVVFASGCVDRAVGVPPIYTELETTSWMRSHQLSSRDVDLLFVVDSSGSMSEEQQQISQQFSALVQALRRMRGGLPNVHLGVTSTDLGTGMFNITYCEPGGDGGALLTGTCPNPVGAPYIVDVEPAGCDIEKELDSAGTLTACLAHDCQESHCSEPGTTLQMDALGCPRCRNYQGESLEDVFSCVAGLGTLGCGFEQPLEALRKAVALDNNANEGFIRDHALLAVVLLTDEDDCSASNPVLFDDSQTTVDSTLGPLTGFRCFEFGIRCDVNERMTEGYRSGCAPRNDAESLLHPVSRYTEALRQLKPQESLVVAAIAGPVDEASGVTVFRDEYDQPALEYSCGDGLRFGAVPGFRLRAFVEAFNAPEDMGWAFTPICSSAYSEALQGVGDKIAVLLDWCPPAPLLGCPDPAALTGQGADALACNDACHPPCTVTDVTDEGREALPQCLLVCPGGPCPDNVDPGRAYAGGRPPRRDPALPVPGCWYVAHAPRCTEARGAELRISRRADPSQRTHTELRCPVLAEHETWCYGGRDDDGDCLVDAEDPDCD
jgi:hypothetical protein